MNASVILRFGSVGALAALLSGCGRGDAHGIGAIDLVVVNLYPFLQTVMSGADRDTIIENIDIGGPAMVRSSAKNHAFVGIVTEPEDYAAVMAELDRWGQEGMPEGQVSLAPKTQDEAAS